MQTVFFRELTGCQFNVAEFPFTETGSTETEKPGKFCFWSFSRFISVCFNIAWALYFSRSCLLWASSSTVWAYSAQISFFLSVCLWVCAGTYLKEPWFHQAVSLTLAREIFLSNTFWWPHCFTPKVTTVTQFFHNAISHIHVTSFSSQVPICNGAANALLWIIDSLVSKCAFLSNVR